MKLIKCDDFCFKVKWGKKFIWPDTLGYKECYYNEEQIPNIIKEIEEEYPRYKGKVTPFRRCLVQHVYSVNA